jgi:hypothetical protein
MCAQVQGLGTKMSQAFWYNGCAMELRMEWAHGSPGVGEGVPSPPPVDRLAKSTVVEPSELWKARPPLALLGPAAAMISKADAVAADAGSPTCLKGKQSEGLRTE